MSDDAMSLADDQSAVLVPLAERVFDFYGDPIPVALVRANEMYVPLRAISDFLGLDWRAQYQRLERDPLLSSRARLVRMHAADNRQRELVCLPLRLLPGWLFRISVRRARPELQEKLMRYQEECYETLYQKWQAESATAQLAPASSTALLAQTRNLALAVAQMAEQQLLHDAQLGSLDGRVAEQSTALEAQGGELTQVKDRLDRAAAFFQGISRRLADVERRLAPGPVTEEQAAEIQRSVKLLAGLLSRANPSKNHYQSVFEELYNRFGVTSYKNVRAERFPEVMAFLDEWRGAVQAGLERDEQRPGALPPPVA